MIVSLSTSEPIVSATFRALRLPRRGLGRGDLAKFFVDTLDQVVSFLIQRVDVALRRRDLEIVRRARFVLLVPQLDVGLRQPRDEVAESVGHGSKYKEARRLRLFASMNDTPRICIVMMSAAGDAVHTLPVVNALKRHRKHC